MAAYALRRLLQLPLSLLLVSSVVFFVIRLVPGDPINIAAETARDAAEKERIRAAFGLDKPLAVPYVTFLANALHGDFGRSYFSNAPVAEQIWARVPATLELALYAMVIGL